ncbi:atrial natriuretic peptide receptor 1-like [Salmo salar]|uniref:Atrial natriuretic peptide receptor 1-like n=1 Tax=Salmo salar TaxID=8030 RepID=A0ABM3F5L9_SALSA|nr:atrial natriuretic peptide receptor 1-like [Salmo salar]
MSRGDVDDSVAKQAYQALFVLFLYKPNDQRYWNFSNDVIRRSREDFGYAYAPNEKVSVLAAIAHDSVWLYAQALNETLAEHGDPYDGFTITRKMWNRTFTGHPTPSTPVPALSPPRLTQGGREKEKGVRQREGE